MSSDEQHLLLISEQRNGLFGKRKALFFVAGAFVLIWAVMVSATASGAPLRTVPLYQLVSQQATFNGAQGSLSSAGLSLESAHVNHDAGMAMWLGNSFRARVLSFSHSGSLTGGSRQGQLTFIFIRAQSWEDYAKDQELGQRSFRPAKVAARKQFNIPPGTNKVTLMLVGDGKFQVSLTDVKVTTP